jgi:hypothetical protein
MVSKFSHWKAKGTAIESCAMEGRGRACLLPRMIWSSFVRSLNIGILYMSCLRSQKVPKSVWNTRFRDASNSTQPVSNWSIWTWLFYEKIVFSHFRSCVHDSPTPRQKSIVQGLFGAAGGLVWSRLAFPKKGGRADSDASGDHTLQVPNSRWSIENEQMVSWRI